jgi:hypothetical protein
MVTRIRHEQTTLEFLSYEGKGHLIKPIGYQTILKRCIANTRVRSAKEQFEIHTISLQWTSDILRFPQIGAMVDDYAYTMEHIYGGVLVPAHRYPEYPELLAALDDYILYMIDEGYFPHGYTIFRSYDGAFVLLDFSQFGTVANMQVRFKMYRAPISLGLAHAMFGTISFRPVSLIEEFDDGFGYLGFLSVKIEDM